MELGRRTTIHVAAKTGMQESETATATVIWLWPCHIATSDDLIYSSFRAIDVVDVFNAVIEFAERVSDSSGWQQRSPALRPP